MTRLATCCVCLEAKPPREFFRVKFVKRVICKLCRAEEKRKEQEADRAKIIPIRSYQENGMTVKVLADGVAYGAWTYQQATRGSTRPAIRIGNQGAHFGGAKL